MTGGTRVTEHLADLPIFDPNSIRYKDLQMLLAPRGSGKSTLLFHWILYMAPKIVAPLVISHTETATHWFENKVKIPPQFIWNEYSNTSSPTSLKDRDYCDRRHPQDIVMRQVVLSTSLWRIS